MPESSNTAPKHGIFLWNIDEDPNHLVRAAVAAEEAGWDGVFFHDLLAVPADWNPDRPDPWTMLASIATSTESIRLGTYVTPIPRRQPWQFARDLATLDQLSNGRVMVGAGLGRDWDYTTFGQSYDLRQLGQQYDEALDIITGLWSGEPFSYDGDHYTIDNAQMRPTPLQQPRIPILIGGLWPNKKPFHRGARWDGIMPHYRGDGIVSEDGIEGLVEGGDVDPEAELRAMLDYYQGIADDPGEVFLPADPPHASSDWVDVCTELGATWLLTRNTRTRDAAGELNLDMQRIREGPPA